MAMQDVEACSPCCSLTQRVRMTWIPESAIEWRDDIDLEAIVDMGFLTELPEFRLERCTII